jgi:ectoine hydroxylase-related dioxygenase (phytanoyl-CoA dioxygenase family)
VVASPGGPVTATLQGYAERGYAICRGVLDPDEAIALKEECDRLHEEHLAAGEPDDIRVVTRGSDDGGPVRDRIDPVSDISPPIAGLVSDPRVVALAAAALGEEAVPFKDKLIYKRPGTHGYTPHQDYTFWQEVPAPPDGIVTVLVAVDPAGPANGGLSLYPGRHGAHHVTDVDMRDWLAPGGGLTPPEAIAGVTPETPELAAGDMIVFGTLVPHESGPNRSDRSRCTLFLTYSAARYGDLTAAHYTSFHTHAR